MFDAVDTNHDGVISKSEFTAALAGGSDAATMPAAVTYEAAPQVAMPTITYAAAPTYTYMTAPAQPIQYVMASPAEAQPIQYVVQQPGEQIQYVMPGEQIQYVMPGEQVQYIQQEVPLEGSTEPAHQIVYEAAPAGAPVQYVYEAAPQQVMYAAPTYVGEDGSPIVMEQGFAMGPSYTYFDYSAATFVEPAAYIGTGDSAPLTTGAAQDVAGTQTTDATAKASKKEKSKKKASSKKGKKGCC